MEKWNSFISVCLGWKRSSDVVGVEVEMNRYSGSLSIQLRTRRLLS